MSPRDIVKIDEHKCDGCGLCVPQCSEGAIQIIDGKARLVSEVYCDGLGACLGSCPRDAITIERREAADFDEQKTMEHMRKMDSAEAAEAKPTAAAETKPAEANKPQGFVCPGAMARSFNRENQPGGNGSGDSGRMDRNQSLTAGPTQPSALRQWPVQLRLVPVSAPFLKDADLLLSADCVPFAFPDFHRKFLQDHSVVVGCPKLDDLSEYAAKIKDIVAQGQIRSLTVIRMEVPCCSGLARIASDALESEDPGISFRDVVIGIDGAIKSDVTSH